MLSVFLSEMMVRIRKALWLVLAMLSLSILLVVLGVYTTTRTESLDVSGYTSGVIVSCVFICDNSPNHLFSQVT